MSTSDWPSDSYDRATTPSSHPPFDLQNSLDKLEKQKDNLREVETKVEEARRILVRDIPKIQKVQPYLRNRENFAQYYSPKLVSIGPIHRDSQERLKGGERYKMIWAAMYLKFTNQSAKSLFRKIRNELPALMEMYAEEVIEGFRGNNNEEEELAWIFLLDGCAVLEFIRNHKEDTEKPEAKLNIKVDQLVLVHQDLLLLENQLPYRLLTLLCDGPENDLNQWIEIFLKTHPMATSTNASTRSSKGSPEVKINMNVNQTPHLLHVLRQTILGPENESNKGGGGSERWKRDEFQTYRNIQELKAAGIAVTKWKGENKSLTDIEFHPGINLKPKGIGKLKLKPLTVDDLMLPKFLNLIAYEMCPDFENRYEISSYVAFMDSLIDHADDVKQLREARILHNMLGSDEDVAHLFNTISTDLMPDTDRYRDVRKSLNKRYNTIWLTWVAQFVDDHFRTPWAFLGFVAAIIALFLTFVQTWYSMHPAPSNDTHPPPHT